MSRRELQARLNAALGYAPIVHERARFFLRELSGRRVVAPYRPRGFALRVLVRHNTPGSGDESFDKFPLHEVFRERCYEPPPLPARSLDRTSLRIVDLGAHLGYFGAFALSRFPQARVTSWEPDPAHFPLLLDCIRLNGLAARWDAHEAAASTRDGTLRLASGRSIATHAASLSGEHDDLIEVAAQDVLPALQRADLAKIDVEGSEWDLLLDPRFGDPGPSALVLEYHSGGCPGDNPKRVARERLEALGYEVLFPVDDPNPEAAPFWGRGLLWAVHQRA